jgi:hypothetical protein
MDLTTACGERGFNGECTFENCLVLLAHGLPAAEVIISSIVSPSALILRLSYHKRKETRWCAL